MLQCQQIKISLTTIKPIIDIIYVFEGLVTILVGP